MKHILIPIVAIAGLGLTLVPALLVFSNQMEASLQKQLMALGMVLWFVAGPLWMRTRRG
ncbi:MAG: hypothetical protein RIC19_24845 [Phaeodactylibacter sp.]|uniref:hypothetical protein n=1 Tax=Phaeodactylibacter sp. TaxID=1940289 RepID=UPI0032EAA469